jgi:putative PIN family toxin of toxin-antitoxin system
MPTVVLDTNVVLDLWHFNDVRCTGLRQAIDAGALHIVTSAALDDELNDVLSRDQFVASRATVVERWQRAAVRIDVHTRAPWLCRDRADQMLLDLAVAARAELLLTKDKALLTLARKARPAGLTIASPDSVS